MGRPVVPEVNMMRETSSMSRFTLGTLGVMPSRASIMRMAPPQSCGSSTFRVKVTGESSVTKYLTSVTMTCSRGVVALTLAMMG